MFLKDCYYCGYNFNFDNSLYEGDKPICDRCIYRRKLPDFIENCAICNKEFYHCRHNICYDCCEKLDLSFCYRCKYHVPYVDFQPQKLDKRLRKKCCKYCVS